MVSVAAITKQPSPADARVTHAASRNGSTPRVLWSRALRGVTDVRWSDDGARLVVAADGARVFDGTTARCCKGASTSA